LHLQTVGWYIILETFSRFSTTYVLKQPWGEYVSKQQGGIEEFVGILRAFPQHLVSGIFIMIGISTKQNNLFRSGLLAEMAYEIVDCSRLRTMPRNENSKTLLIAMLLHHLPGILAIIPANLYCSNDVYFQQIPYALLANAWFGLLMTVACRTFNLENLYERTRFTVFYMLSFMTFMYSRLYWLPITFYEFIYHRFHETSWPLIILFIIYATSITVFNLCVLLITVQRLQKMMYGKEPEQAKAAVLLRQNSYGVRKLEDFFNQVPRGTVSPLKRASTTPIYDKKRKSN